MIRFHQAYHSYNEADNIMQALDQNGLAGDGHFSARCQLELIKRYSFPNVLMTTSATSALEMCALMLDLKEGDEVILPSYAFVSVANAFLMHGAKLVFGDSEEDRPHISAEHARSLVTEKTKAIVVIQYAGLAADMEAFRELADEHGLMLIEDAAQGIGAKYQDKAIGSFGDLSVMSFHESKNIHCGEGGALIINKSILADRAKLIWNKGTNREDFMIGVASKYEWVDRGGSYQLSDLNASMLLAQLEDLEEVNEKRSSLFDAYTSEISGHGVQTLELSSDDLGNGHLFYVVLEESSSREDIINSLLDKGIDARFHFQSLHSSPYYKDKYQGQELPQADKYSNRLLRLPLHHAMEQEDVQKVVSELKQLI